MTLCVAPLFLTCSRESKISHSDRVQCGVTEEQLWLKINEPTEKDKGKYAIDIFDGTGSLKRVLDLSGQGKSSGVPTQVTLQYFCIH